MGFQIEKTSLQTKIFDTDNERLSHFDSVRWNYIGTIHVLDKQCRNNLILSVRYVKYINLHVKLQKSYI